VTGAARQRANRADPPASRPIGTGRRAPWAIELFTVHPVSPAFAALRIGGGASSCLRNNGSLGSMLSTYKYLEPHRFAGTFLATSLR
jgi:hypothetical protein